MRRPHLQNHLLFLPEVERFDQLPRPQIPDVHAMAIL